MNWSRETWLKISLALLGILFFVVVLLGPLSTLIFRSLENESRDFIGLANYIRYLSEPSLFQTFWNTISVSVITSLITVSAAFFFAYGLQRTTMPGKSLFRMIAISPMFAPSLMQGIALIYLFGRKGLFTTGFFGTIPPIEVDIYGPLGIIVAESIANFPSAFLLLSVAFTLSDRRLREAALVMGAKRWLRFIAITLPSVKYGVFSALLVVFTSSFVDFGAPKVIGGNFNVLSVEVYKQVVGLQNFNLGAAISLLLALPAILAFWLDHKVQSNARMTFSSKSLPSLPTGGVWRNLLFFLGNSTVAIILLGVNFVVLYASLVKTWPYSLDLTLAHYDFRDVAGGGLDAFWTSIQMSLWTAAIGSLMAFILAWLTQRSRLSNLMTQPIRFFALLPMSLPGMVIGLSFIFFFNSPTMGLWIFTINNPLGFLYNSFAILVIANLVHFIPVPYLTCTGAISKLDPEMESAAMSMGVPFWKTMAYVTLPMSLDAVLESFLYIFMNSMVTVSAVIFLFSPDIHLASICLVDMEDAGDTAAAAAMSMLIVATNILARGLYLLFRRIRFLKNKG